MSEEKNKGMEQAILEAAENLFLEKGFALTSTTEIARTAGCNQALVHYYFRTKDKLFEAIFEKKANMVITAFLEPLDDTLSFEEKLTIRIERHFDFLRSNPNIPFLFFNEVITNPTRLNKMKDRIKEIPNAILNNMESELKNEIAAGRIRPVSTFDLMMTVASLNIVPFFIRPALLTITGMSRKEYDQMLDTRKKENVTTILRSLRP